MANQPLMLKKLKLNGSMKIYKTSLELTPKKDVLFIIGYWNAKVVSQETTGVNRLNLALEYGMKQGKD